MEDKRNKEIWESKRAQKLVEITKLVVDQLLSLGRTDLIEKIVCKSNNLWVGDNVYFGIEKIHTFDMKYWACKRSISPMGNAGISSIASDEKDIVQVVLAGLLYLVNLEPKTKEA